MISHSQILYFMSLEYKLFLNFITFLEKVLKASQEKKNLHVSVPISNFRGFTAS